MTELRRALGRWDLTAIGVNQVIGAAIFIMPAQVAAQIGAWSPVAFVLTGLASMSVALCFAEVGSRFEETGGPYLYTRAAFGRFIAFEVGWMQWFTRSASQATVMALLAVALGYYWPALSAGAPRIVFLTALTAVLTWINIRGIRQSAFVVNVLTVGKLLPLALFAAAGIFYVNWAQLVPTTTVTMSGATAAALLLIYTYGGYEVVPVVAGEAIEPRRHVPFAMVATILIATAVMTLTQLVAQGVLGNLAEHRTPIADAAAVLFGAAGAMLVGAGSAISMTGNNAGGILSGSRTLFALAEHGDLLPVFGRLHPRFQTPVFSIVFTSAVALALALTGTFTTTAIVSAVARLVMYAGVSAATLRLRSPQFVGVVRPAAFTIPAGPVVPAFAMLVALAILAGATREQLLGGLAALAAGAVLFAATVVRRRSNTPYVGSRFSSSR